MAGKTVVHWFRKGLRVHDNLGLFEAAQSKEVTCLFPVFVIDPYFISIEKVGLNRMRFLLESLTNLNESLQKLGSRLIVLRGTPAVEIPKLVCAVSASTLSFECDTEPYAKRRDAAVLKKLGVDKMQEESREHCATYRGSGEHDLQVLLHSSHTLFVPENVCEANGGKPPPTYQSFLKLVEGGKKGKRTRDGGKALAAPGSPLPPIEHLPPADIKKLKELVGASSALDDSFAVPTLNELGYPDKEAVNVWFTGGESEALQRMEQYLSNRKQVLSFEKPKTAPTAFDPPETTTLSPYLKFGCLSIRTFYHRLMEVYEEGQHTQPPVSLLGQIYWREFFYTSSSMTQGYDRMETNDLCVNVNWNRKGAKEVDENWEEQFEAWKDGRTGYPFIDAIMRQLKEIGWMHHLARHAVACFLTRGDLWISWEHGRDHFDTYLLDADWSLNNANWLWLSASAYFHQYFRVYSPVSFGQKTDKNGDFIRRFVPELKKFPAKYIYEPWKAPISVQSSCGCIIGTDYPPPIVDHDTVRRRNIDRMKAARGK